MDRIEAEGATVEEAVQAALRQLGRRKEDVEVEVLEEGRRGLFGIGAKPAKVAVSLKQGGTLSPEAVHRASDFLVEVIRRMGMDVEVEAKQIGDELYLEVDQGAGGILIGRHGTTLAALSYLMERIVNNSEDAHVKVFVDVAGYLERRRRSLLTMAEEMAAEAKATGREIQCGPMSAFERKVIHTALHDDQTVRTFSRGEGADRRLVIAPLKPGEVREPPAGRAGRRAEGRFGARGDHRRGGRERGRGADGGGERPGAASGRGAGEFHDPGPLERYEPSQQQDEGGGERRRRRRGRRGGRRRRGGGREPASEGGNRGAAPGADGGGGVPER